MNVSHSLVQEDKNKLQWLRWQRHLKLRCYKPSNNAQLVAAILFVKRHNHRNKTLAYFDTENKLPAKAVKEMNRSYLTEDLPGFRLIEEANNNSGILSLGSARERKEQSHTGVGHEKHKLNGPR